MEPVKLTSTLIEGAEALEKAGVAKGQGMAVADKLVNLGFFIVPDRIDKDLDHAILELFELPEEVKTRKVKDAMQVMIQASMELTFLRPYFDMAQDIAAGAEIRVPEGEAGGLNSKLTIALAVVHSALGKIRQWEGLDVHQDGARIKKVIDDAGQEVKSILGGPHA